MSAEMENNEYYDLGSFGRKVTTSSAEAQTWFDRGLTWVYGFGHEEAVECFEKAISHDPSCAMAYWGVAYAQGPNYNKPWKGFDLEDRKKSVKITNHASRDAKAHSENATPLEKALIDAFQLRFASDSETDLAKLGEQNHAYAVRMEEIYREFGDDPDVASIYADSWMNLDAWNLWNIYTGEPNPMTRTSDMKKVLERGLGQEGGMKHPGLLHFYVHLIEMSTEPELGLGPANQLRTLIPDAGHLCHMPSHLDILLGDYESSISANYAATIADDKFLRRSGGSNFYSFYRLHNYHSLIYAAMFSGQKSISLETVDRMEAALPKEVFKIKSPPMADLLEAFLAVRAHVMVRFGMWHEITELAIPEDQNLYCVTTATIHYAKGVAYAATNKVSEAEHQRSLFHEAFKRVPVTRLDYPNKCVDILAVAAEMLDGEIEYRRGNYKQAFERLHRSIDLDDKLIYSEPWGWMQPARHAYAALTLEQGNVEEACKAYKADLGLDDTLPRARRHPNNVWALQGYHECLLRLGREEEAAAIESQVKEAIATADIPVKSSCFCRTNTS